MGDELAQDLLDTLLKNVDTLNQDQQERLKYMKKRDMQNVLLGKDVIHHDERKIKKSVTQARDRVFQEKLWMNLDEMLRNWDDRDERKKNLQRYQDIQVGRALAEGVQGASLADKKMRSGGKDFDF